MRTSLNVPNNYQNNSVFCVFLLDALIHNFIVLSYPCIYIQVLNTPRITVCKDRIPHLPHLIHKALMTVELKGKGVKKQAAVSVCPDCTPAGVSTSYLKRAPHKETH